MSDQLPISDRQLARIQDVFGEAHAALPWTSTGEARAALDARVQRDVERFATRVDHSWREEQPWRETVEALADLFPDDYVGSYGGRFADGAPVGVMSNGDGGRPLLGAPSFFRLEGIQRNRQYGPGRPIAFGDRPVSFAALASRFGSADAALETFRTGYPTGEIGNQLRTVLTTERSGRQAIACMVFVLRRRRRGFTLEEHQRLLAVQPALRRWHVHTEALGREPFAAGGLPVQLLDAFEAPAVVVHGRRIVHANRSARSAAGLPVDVQALRSLATSRQRFCADGGRDYELLVLPPIVSRIALDTLSPALREVASLLARGASDKEIAVALDRPLSTVRTYTKRVLQRLGVHSRRDLMRAYGDVARDPR